MICVIYRVYIHDVRVSGLVPKDAHRSLMCPVTIWSFSRRKKNDGTDSNRLDLGPCAHRYPLILTYNDICIHADMCPLLIIINDLRLRYNEYLECRRDVSAFAWMNWWRTIWLWRASFKAHIFIAQIDIDVYIEVHTNMCTDRYGSESLIAGKHGESRESQTSSG